MKLTLQIVRWLVGLLFIFSGLIKANDPLGLSYKMQEFFEVWQLHQLNQYSLVFAFIMNVFEVVAGVALIIGWQIRPFIWLLLILISFFSFLTGYAVFNPDKIKTCGCFGDCLPLTPIQSFTKDIVLLLSILFLLINYKKLKSFSKASISVIVLIITIASTILLQWYVLRYLPVVDCLPYKKGNNILQQMKIPDNAATDSVVIFFKYKRNGKVVEFDQEHFPNDFDSSYEFINRYDKLIRKGNATAPITDFALQSLQSADTTTAILNQQHYILLFIKDMANFNNWKDDFIKIHQLALSKQLPLQIVTADPLNATQLLQNVTILKCDVTAVKTAARANPTYFIMQQANIKEKYSYRNVNRVISYIQQLNKPKQ